jgi:hypothetical protein
MCCPLFVRERPQLLWQPTACSSSQRIQIPSAYTLPDNASRTSPGMHCKPGQAQCTSPRVSLVLHYCLLVQRYRRCTAAKYTVFMVILCVTVGWERFYSASPPSDCELVLSSSITWRYIFNFQSEFICCSIHLLLLRSAQSH